RGSPSSPAEFCRSLRRQRHASGGVAATTVRPVTKTQSSVQVLVRSHAATGKTASPLHRLDLQSQVQKADGVIAVDGALELQGEDTLEVTLGARHKGASPLRRRHLEAAIELRRIALLQKAIGLGQGGASGQPQLLRQASLPGSEVALTAAPRLRRISGNHANPEFAQRPSHLGQTVRINRFSRLRSQPEVAAAIAVQGAEQALALDHRAQRCHHRCRRFFLHQLRVVDLAGGVVQDDDQVIPTLILKPTVTGTRRCATASRADAAADSAGDALLAFALASPVRLLATPASPRCSSARSGARAATSPGNAARSDRNTDRGRAPALAPPAPPAPVWARACLAAGRTDRHSQTPRNALASAASADH